MYACQLISSQNEPEGTVWGFTLSFNNVMNCYIWHLHIVSGIILFWYVDITGNKSSTMPVCTWWPLSYIQASIFCTRRQVIWLYQLKENKKIMHFMITLNIKNLGWQIQKTLSAKGYTNKVQLYFFNFIM